MADERKIIYLEINATKAVEGSSAATRALQQLEQSTSSLDKTLSRMEGALGRVGGYLKAQLAMMIGEFIGHMIEMAKASLEAAAGLDELGEQLGVSARFLQAAQYQAVQTGAKLEQLETGFSKFSQKIGEAANGSKEMIESLDRVGVKILDFQGKLRPTEDVMTDVAKAIVGIEDPAKRSAAAVDFFGKAGTRLLPLLTELAKGADSMAVATERQNAMIGDETIKKLDAVADRLERSKLEWRAFFANNAAAAIDWLDKAQGWLDKMLPRDETSMANRRKAWQEPLEDFFDWLGDQLNDMVAYGAKFGAEFLESFATLPGAMKNLFIRAMDNSLEALETGLNKIKAGMAGSWLGRQLDIDGSAVSLGRIGGVQSNADYLANRNQQISSAGQQAYDAARAMSPQGGNADARARSRFLQGQIDAQASEEAARVGKLGLVSGGGVSNPAVAGAGKAEAERIEKLKNTLAAAADAQDAMTAAAMRGDLAFQEQEIKAKSLSQAIEAYGGQFDKSSPKVQQLAKDIEDYNRRAIQGKTAETFAFATTQLERQNEILKAQNDLMNEAPEIQARELAIIKAKQEAEKGGLSINAEMLEKRREAIEQNETLKLQQDQLKKAQELWAEPLKQAFRDLQTAGANAFEEMLNSGKISFESLGQVFRKIVTRMAAEFLALATIRPVMSVLVNAVSPSMAQQMGFGNAGGTGTGMPSVGGGGLGSIFGGSGGFSSIGDALGDAWGTTRNWFGGLFGGGSTPYQNVGQLMAGQGIGSAGVGLGGYLGAGLGAVSGIAQLIGGGGSTKSTVGGISSLIGAGVSLIPGIGQIAGPLIAIAGSLLGGLFGEEKPKPPILRASGEIRWGSGGYSTHGMENNGAQAVTPQLGATGRSMADLYRLAGGIRDNSRVYGIGMSTFSQGDFSNATSYLLNPDGTRKQWGMGSNEKDLGMQALTAHAAYNTLLEAVKLGDNLKKALVGIDPRTLDQLAEVIGEVNSFDDALKHFGKTVTSAEAAITSVDKSFDALYTTAAKYGLDDSGITKERARARLEAADAFANPIRRQLMDPLTASLTELGDERTAQIGNNAYFRDHVAGYQDQILNIEALYARKRAKIIEDSNAQATAALATAAQAAAAKLHDLDALIKRLTPGGDLANTDPSGQLAGLKATYNATRAQAFAGNAAALDRFSTDAGAFAEFSQRYYGGSAAYNRDRDQIIADAQALQQQIGGGTPGASAGSPAAGASLNAQFQQLMAAFAQGQQDNAELRNELTRVTNLLRRYLAAA